MLRRGWGEQTKYQTEYQFTCIHYIKSLDNRVCNVLGGGGVSRQSTRLSIRDTPLDTSTRLRKRSSMNVSYKDAEETMEPVDLGPTLEERRQEIIDR